MKTGISPGKLRLAATRLLEVRAVQRGDYGLYQNRRDAEEWLATILLTTLQQTHDRCEQAAVRMEQDVARINALEADVARLELALIEALAEQDSLGVG